MAGRQLAFDPSTDTLYALLGADWFRVDRASGAVTLDRTISGFLPVHLPTVWVFDLSGAAFAVCHPDANGQAVYTVSSGSATATYLGQANLGPFMYALDGEFQQPDTMLLSHFSMLSSATGGVSRLDLTTLAVTQVVDWQDVGGSVRYLASAPPTAMSTYCAARTNSLGCSPTISAAGYASATGTQGFVIRASGVLNNTNGMLVWSMSGRAAIPFHGGTLCLTPPLYRTPVLNSGNKITVPVNCEGVWSRDVNTWFDSTVPLPPGVTVRTQWYGRDPGYSAPNDAQLSNALEFVLRP